MPKKARLTRKDFPHVRGVFREHGLFFSVSVAPSPSGAKVTCVVPKKVAAKATDRNRIKRRTRAILLELLPSMPPALLLVQSKKDSSGASYEALHKDLASIVKKLRARHGV